MPDTVCSDLSWPGFCLEDLSSGHIDAGGRSRPVLVHASGPQNSHLALLRPRPSRFGARPPLAAAAAGDGGGAGRIGGTAPTAPCGLDPQAAAAAAAAATTVDASTAIELENRIALHAGPIRQIATLASRAGAPPRLFARCDYSATLVGACKVVDRLGQPPEWGGRAVYERRIRRAKIAAGMPIAVDDAATVGAFSSSLSAPPALPARRGVGVGDGGGGDEEEGEEEEGEGEDEEPDPFAGLDGFAEEERLVFSRRLACAACSPFTPTHAAFLDEEFRLFQWHAGRGTAAAHGPGPLPLAAAPAALPVPRSEARARRARNADVALDYGAHPRVLWVAARHRAYRVDLRERPTPAALAPALNPGLYYATHHGEEPGGGDRGKREAAAVRSLAVGRRSAHEVFVAAGPHLSCMDARFPRDAVARWDLPQEADQLRWLPGVPGEGADAEGRSATQGSALQCTLWKFGAAGKGSFCLCACAVFRGAAPRRLFSLKPAPSFCFLPALFGTFLLMRAHPINSSRDET